MFRGLSGLELPRGTSIDLLYAGGAQSNRLKRQWKLYYGLLGEAHSRISTVHCTASELTDPTGYVKHEISRYNASQELNLASTPPSSWYTHPGFDALEMNAVFAHSWQFAARRDQLTESGRYLATTVGSEQVLLVNHGEISAFYNVCRHHAAAVAEGDGLASAFHCPYHGWTYNLDGSLRSTPNFGDADAFDLSCNGLIPLRVETLGPFIFVTPGDDLPPLAEWAGAQLAEAFVDPAIASLQFFERREYEVACNWKVYVDNYLDGGYHVPILHRGLSQAIDNTSYVTTLHTRSSVQRCATSTGSAVRSGDARYYWLYPNVMFNFYDGILDTNLVLPRGPDRCSVIFDFYFDNRPTHSAAFKRDSIEVADQVQREDEDVCASVQRGLSSRAYDTGRLSPAREAGEHLFHKLLFHDYIRHLDTM